MDIPDARRIGGRKAAFACLMMFIFFEALMFFVGAHGDFLHEGRSFMLSQLDPLSTSVVVIAFVTVFLLGRVAGRQILAGGRNHMLVALTHWAITMGVLIVYVFGFAWLMRLIIEEWGNFLLVLALIIGCVWLIAVRGIKRAGHTK
ncbi:MAG TPA: hypothetical protein VFE32_04795 [Puia sp.]|jgi:hypothetical protein|nr:hypothetical protein [Puia sp.]